MIGKTISHYKILDKLGEGREEPVWSGTGRQLFYRNGGQWMVSSCSTEKGFVFSTPRLYLEGEYLNVGGRSFDVSIDGKRLLLLKGIGNKSSYFKLNVVLD